MLSECPSHNLITPHRLLWASTHRMCFCPGSEGSCRKERGPPTPARVSCVQASSKSKQPTPQLPQGALESDRLSPTLSSKFFLSVIENRQTPTDKPGTDRGVMMERSSFLSGSPDWGVSGARHSCVCSPTRLHTEDLTHVYMVLCISHDQCPLDPSARVINHMTPARK